jgi:DNA-binding NtrC family response regulator
VSCRILIVEDDFLSRRNFAFFLKRAQHDVSEAVTGETAVDLISRMSFDVVVSDLRLPGRVNGIDVLRHQSRHAPGKRLILITAFGSAEAQSEAETLGAVYMEKPVSLLDLATSVRIRA